MRIGTASIRHAGFYGNRALNITAKSAGPTGKVFAPSWQIVMDFKKDIITWEEYEQKYKQMMRNSYRHHRKVWDEVMSRDEVILICYCPSSQFCHRRILHSIFITLGAEDSGIHQ